MEALGEDDALEAFVAGEQEGREVGEVGLVADDEAVVVEGVELRGDGGGVVAGGEAVALLEGDFELEAEGDVFGGFVGADQAALPDGGGLQHLVAGEGFGEAGTLAVPFGAEGAKGVAGGVGFGVGVAEKVEVLNHVGERWRVEV